MDKDLVRAGMCACSNLTKIQFKNKNNEEEVYLHSLWLRT